MDFEIPLWLIITFGVCVVAWPLILMAGGTAIVSLIVAAAAKSALALKVAGIAAAVFFSPLAIGILGAPILKILFQIRALANGRRTRLLSVR